MKKYHFESVSSTNDKARELLEKDNIVFVSADFQSKGRGRNNKSWEGNPSDNIYFSAGITKPELLNPERIPFYQAIGTLAAMHAISDLTKSKIFRMKYPNDIMVKCKDGKSRKICGVLSENCFLGNVCTYAIVGIGVNVNQEVFEKELEDEAISLKNLGFAVQTDELLKLIEKYLEELIKLNDKAIHNIWQSELKIEGKSISIVGNEKSWIADSLLADGRLQVISPENLEQRIIDNGDSIEYDY